MASGAIQLDTLYPSKDVNPGSLSRISIELGHSEPGFYKSWHNQQYLKMSKCKECDARERAAGRRLAKMTVSSGCSARYGKEISHCLGTSEN